MTMYDVLSVLAGMGLLAAAVFLFAALSLLVREKGPSLAAIGRRVAGKVSAFFARAVTRIKNVRDDIADHGGLLGYLHPGVRRVFAEMDEENDYLRGRLVAKENTIQDIREERDVAYYELNNALTSLRVELAKKPEKRATKKRATKTGKRK